MGPEENKNEEILTVLSRLEDVFYAFATDMDGKRVVETRHLTDIISKIRNELRSNS